MTRLRGRALRGTRVHASAPQGYWQTTTMICSVRLDGSTACMTVNGATDTEAFRTYVRCVLGPTLRPGDVVIMDNLSPHKSQLTLLLIAQAAPRCSSFRPTRLTSTRLKKCGAKSNNTSGAQNLAPNRI